MYGTTGFNPDFVVIRQDSLAKEMFSRNDVMKTVHVVSKNLPFVIQVGSSSLDLHNARLYARLLYDSDHDMNFKEVDYVNLQLEVVSEPFRVVSKPSQVGKERRRAKSAGARAAAQLDSPSADSSSSPPPPVQSSGV